VKVAEKIAKTIKRMKEGTAFGYAQLKIEPDQFSAAAKALERLVVKEIIRRVSKGKFYKPRQSVFGELRPPEDEVLKLYLYSQNKRIAYITGTALYNRMGLTTQVPKTIKVASRDKRISVNSGSIQARPAKSYVDVTDDNFYLLELLDALKDFSNIPDLDKKMGINYLKGRLSRLSKKEKSQIIRYALQYPPRVRALLGALLSDVGLSRDVEALKDSLNPLTIYRLGIDEKWLGNVSKWHIV